jgi:mRNA-degrading endonuclease RelE of RelBE toxin-antitoxin system
VRWTIEWSDEAKRELRAIDRKAALDILHCADRYLVTREGDVKQLKPPLSGSRLRCGNYRIFFTQPTSTGIRVDSVRHRQDAYR